MSRLRHVILAALLAAAVPACGEDSSSDPTNQTETQEPGEASAEISAAEGGVLTLDDAALSVPPGALAEDTTLTVESAEPSDDLPDAASLTGLTYEFGPDGTTFAEPVTLTLPASKPGEGKEAVIAWLDEESGTWNDLATTASADGALSAEVTHFTLFVVRVRNVASGAIDCGFSPCGGDPVGTWTVAGACIDTGSTDSPLGDKCPDATIGIELDATGTLELTGDRYTWDLTLQGSASYTVPASCLAELGGMLSDCAALADDEEDTVCTGSIDEGCTCTTPLEPEVQQSTGTYETSGQTLTGTPDDDDEPGAPLQFCVKGDELKMKRVDTNDEGATTELTLIFTR